jgi:hypothetical protein
MREKIHPQSCVALAMAMVIAMATATAMATPSCDSCADNVP